MHQEQRSPLAAPLPLAVARDGRRIPAVHWQPADGARGLVLACHGGSGHKTSNAILMVAQACLPLGLAVVAIDGPVHGERRGDGDLTPGTARAAFRAAWRDGVGRTGMGEDMRAALDAAQRLPGCAGLPIGYVGVSMGTAYGIPMLAVEPRVRAAAIGLWSTDYAASEHLADFARRMRCDVWFTQQWNDEFFDRGATLALFDAIGSADKRLVAYPGPHRELEGERLADAIAFVAGRLLKR